MDLGKALTHPAFLLPPEPKQILIQNSYMCILSCVTQHHWKMTTLTQLLSPTGGEAQPSGSLPLAHLWTGASVLRDESCEVRRGRCRCGALESFPAVCTCFLMVHPGVQSRALMLILVPCLGGSIPASPSVSMPGHSGSLCEF